MKRFVILGVTVVLAVGISAGTFAFAVRKSSAAQQTPAVDLSAKGPSVGVDNWGNQFVAWRGSNAELELAVYTNDTATFSGPFNLRSNSFPMGSEPSLAVANFGGFPSNGHKYGAEFAFWKGSGNGELWYAYWAGDQWHGAFNVHGVSNVASTPSAVFNNIGHMWGPSGSEVTVFWQGTDDHLWYIRLENPLGGVSVGGSTIPGSPAFSGAHEATYIDSTGEHSLGTLGSSPGASPSSPADFSMDGVLVNGVGTVTWKGSTNSNAFFVRYSIDVTTADLEILGAAREATGWTDVDGGPAATEEYALFPTYDNLYDFAWDDSLHHVVFASSALDPQHYPQGFQSPTTLWDTSVASAPSIAYWGGLNPASQFHFYIYYKGQDGYLHEAFWNNTNPGWHLYVYTTFGTLG